MSLYKRFLAFCASRAIRPRKRLSDDAPVREIEKILRYRFRNRQILLDALSHRSYVAEAMDSGNAEVISNERLEFLGDAIVNCLVTIYLYKRHPGRNEGDLSKIKSLVVSRKILGLVGIDLNLGEHLLLGVSEKRTGGRKRGSIISNAFEALVGAIYLDGGMEPCRRFLAAVLFDRMDEFLGDEQNINYKSKILELSQHDGLGIPRYVVVATAGPEHAKQFTIRVEVAGVPLGEGEGSTKKTAQQNAAQNAVNNYDKNYILSRLQRSDSE